MTRDQFIAKLEDLFQQNIIPNCLLTSMASWKTKHDDSLLFNPIIFQLLNPKQWEKFL